MNQWYAPADSLKHDDSFAFSNESMQRSKHGMHRSVSGIGAHGHGQPAGGGSHQHGLHGSCATSGGAHGAAVSGAGAAAPSASSADA